MKEKKIQFLYQKVSKKVFYCVIHAQSCFFIFTNQHFRIEYNSK